MRNLSFIICVTFLFLSFFLATCKKKSSKKEEEKSQTFSSFVANLNQVQIESEQEPFTSENIIIPFRLDLDNYGNVLAVSPSDWNLQLLDKNGVSLGIQGGNGMGPGEFQVVNSIYVDEKNNIFILDMRGNKIESYGVRNDSLIYRMGFSLPSYYPFLIYDFAKVGDQYFGIFKDVFSQHSDGKNDQSFILYSLNDKLEMEEELYVLPTGVVADRKGNGIMQNEFLSYETYRIFRNSKLFIANSKEFSVTEVDLVTRSVKNYDLGYFPKRKKKEEEVDYILDEYEGLTTIFPNVENNLREPGNFPLFSVFDVTSEYAYFRIYNFSEESNSQIIRINLSSNEKELITVSKNFYFYRATDEAVYGIYEGLDRRYPMRIQLDNL
ncbi:MAG: hypothetical protein ED557_13590 [Balneola sp.]|nr:MAG: hypothetical protein ED557_13590 [Balneola sp.]